MAINFRCDECDKRYRVSDERAGKRVKCKECGAMLQVPPLDEPPKSPVGTNILVHEARSREFEFAIGDSENIQAISSHIKRYVGPVHTVFHELISDLVHIDVHWVKPSKERPNHTLITSGMSDRPMTVPDQCDSLRFAELLISLPPGWKVSEEAFKDARNYWPIRLLKFLARFPHEYETWLGSGHTVPNGDPAEPYASNTKLSCSLLLPPLNFDEGFRQLAVDDERTIQFYSIVPIYPEETDFKLNNGLESLLELFGKYNTSEVVDTNRRNTCLRKKWFGLF